MNKKQRLDLFNERFKDTGEVTNFTKDSCFYKLEYKDGYSQKVPLFMGEK